MRAVRLAPNKPAGVTIATRAVGFSGFPRRRGDAARDSVPTPTPHPHPFHTMTDDDICGAECADGSKCQRSAGWGTDSDIGPCITHDHTADVDTGGRPSKFPDVKDDLLDAADSPKNLRQVANAGGIEERTLYRWLDDRPEFCQSFKRARSRAAERLIQRALDPDDDIDRAFVRFLLERSFKFIKTERYEHRVDEDADLTDSEYNFLYE